MYLINNKKQGDKMMVLLKVALCLKKTLQNKTKTSMLTSNKVISPVIPVLCKVHEGFISSISASIAFLQVKSVK